MFDALKAARKAEGLGRKLTVVRNSCLGWCQYAPVVMVMPEGKVVQGLAPEESLDFAKAVASHDDQFLPIRVFFPANPARYAPRKQTRTMILTQPSLSSKPKPASRFVFRPTVAAGLAALLLPGLAARAAEEPPLGQITPNFRVLGELRGRSESNDFFRPALNPAKGITANGNDYTFGGLRARLGVAMNTPWVDGLLQGQYTGLYGLPEDAFAGLPVGPLGLGGAYYKDNGSPNPGAVFLKQGYLKFKLQPMMGLANTYFQGGRFEIADGLEYKTGDAKFDWLKTARVSQRLIGPFDFTHVTRSFDGFQLNYDDPNFNATFSASHPTQGGFNVHAMDQISHIDLTYGALTTKKGALLPDTEARLFYLYYGDNRGVQPVDNRPLAQRPKLSQDALAISTIGTHLLTMQKIGPGALDAMLWGAYQFGDWGNQNQSAWAVTQEIGYQFTDVMFKPWVRAGYFVSSGDGNAKDGTHGTFFTAIPTVRLQAKFPFYNLMNLQDAFVQFIAAPTDTTKVAVDFHHLALTDDSDLFYGGSGATSRSGSFGYFGRASGGNHTIGQMVDLGFTHNVSKYFSWNVYYAHAFGSDVSGSFYQMKNDADYGFVEFTTSF
jgi:(2Fe-2S) ferredoxin